MKALIRAISGAAVMITGALIMNAYDVFSPRARTFWHLLSIFLIIIGAFRLTTANLEIKLEDVKKDKEN